MGVGRSRVSGRGREGGPANATPEKVRLDGNRETNDARRAGDKTSAQKPEGRAAKSVGRAKDKLKPS